MFHFISSLYGIKAFIITFILRLFLAFISYCKCKRIFCKVKTRFFDDESKYFYAENKTNS